MVCRIHELESHQTPNNHRTQAYTLPDDHCKSSSWKAARIGLAMMGMLKFSEVAHVQNSEVAHDRSWRHVALHLIICIYMYNHSFCSVGCHSHIHMLCFLFMHLHSVSNKTIESSNEIVSIEPDPRSLFLKNFPRTFQTLPRSCGMPHQKAPARSQWFWSGLAMGRRADFSWCPGFPPI